MNKPDPLPALLRAFFYEWLVQQRNASGHTVRSYRDTWRLFLRFVARRHNRTVPQLRLEDLTGSEVAAFLQYTEQERSDSTGTRNCRLAALRSASSSPSTPLRLRRRRRLWRRRPSRLTGFRHATAVHLVAAGVDITVIRSWLGHVSLDTTNHYAQANLETKRKALERVGRAARAGKLPRWRRDHDILEWLDSL